MTEHQKQIEELLAIVARQSDHIAKIEKELETMAVSKDQLTSDLAALDAQITALQALNPQPPIDLTDVDTAVNNARAALAAIVTTLTPAPSAPVAPTPAG